MLTSNNKRLSLDQIRVEIKRRQQEIRLATWQITISRLTAAGAFMAAGFGLAKLFT